MQNTQLKKFIYYFSVIITEKEIYRKMLDEISIQLYGTNNNYKDDDDLKKAIKKRISEILNSNLDEVKELQFQPGEIVDNLSQETDRLKIVASFNRFKLTKISINDKIIYED